MTPATAGGPATRAERVAAGKAARKQAPLAGHGPFEPAATRDPVGLLLSQAESRVPELVPIRHARMLASPFTFYRGAALPMAADLATMPSSGLRVQLCGDAHLANFGAFASPERRLVFDLNDFDETLPGPFEWDVKRLAASMVVAARDNGFAVKDQRTAAATVAVRYREAMAAFADMSTMTVWYASLDVDEALERYQAQLKKSQAKKAQRLFAKARSRDSTQALGKLTELVDGKRRIISDPPLVIPIEEVASEMEADQIYGELRTLLTSYSRTLPPERRHLIKQFELVHMARKVVGVGSVGTRAWILLLEADDGTEPLFLQAKEAGASVLADYAGRSKYNNQGARVVSGQRLMQAAGDIFLGWQRATGIDGVSRDFYIRQLRDWKLSAAIEQMRPSGMAAYARLCAWTLARAHARSGDRVAIAAYLGSSDKFDKAIVAFAESYADITEQDHAALASAVESGRAEASAT
jgi:uncharacterized protein (DUF2252 family)